MGTSVCNQGSLVSIYRASYFSIRSRRQVILLPTGCQEVHQDCPSNLPPAVILTLCSPLSNQEVFKGAIHNFSKCLDIPLDLPQLVVLQLPTPGRYVTVKHTQSQFACYPSLVLLIHVCLWCFTCLDASDGNGWVPKPNVYGPAPFLCSAHADDVGEFLIAYTSGNRCLVCPAKSITSKILSFVLHHTTSRSRCRISSRLL